MSYVGNESYKRTAAGAGAPVAADTKNPALDTYTEQTQVFMLLS